MEKELTVDEMIEHNFMDLLGPIPTKRKSVEKRSKPYPTQSKKSQIEVSTTKIEEVHFITIVQTIEGTSSKILIPTLNTKEFIKKIFDAACDSFQSSLLDVK